MKRVLIINGPNLNLLGTREVEHYGKDTLEDIATQCDIKSRELNMEMDFVQSNHEGEIIDRIHESKDNYDVLIINPGAYTHYSIAIRDAIKAVGIPCIEVHISNIYNREEFRNKSIIAPVCVGQITGFGTTSYLTALYAAKMIFKRSHRH